MTDTFSPGDIIVASRPSMVGESWEKHAFLVIEALHAPLPVWPPWILTVMKLDGSSEVTTTYFNSAAWSKIDT